MVAPIFEERMVEGIRSVAWKSKKIVIIISKFVMNSRNEKEDYNFFCGPLQRLESGFSR